MRAIVPLAGKSSRFRDFTDKPKWALRMGPKYALNFAIESLYEQSLNVSEIVIISLPQHRNFVEAALELEPSNCKIKIHEISDHTRGQAETVRQFLSQDAGYMSDSEFVIWNGDSRLAPGWTRDNGPSGDFLVVARLPGNHWSFTQTRGRFATRVSEKVRISPLASVGLYGFETTAKFLQVPETWALGEQFIAPMYNHLINVGEKVRVYEVNSADFLSFGTPNEMREACRALQTSIPIELQI